MRIDLSDSAYFDLSGQMTLHFKHERTVGRWATCNLVFFPVVTLDAEAKLETRLSKSPPTQSTRRRTLFRENTMAFQKTKARSNLLAVMRSGELRRFVQTGVGDLTRAVRNILIKLAENEPDRLLDEGMTDLTGASVIHNLLLSNHDEALSLAAELVKRVPKLLYLTHIDNGGILCLFKGEGPLHIAAVNQREDWILEALDRAYVHDADAVFGPSKTSLDGGKDAAGQTYEFGLLQQTCEGPFFKDAPMSHFGGTVLSYCAAFNLSRVLQWVARRCNGPEQRWHLFNTMRPVFDGREQTSGYSVRDSIVVNGAVKAYDALMSPPCKAQMPEVPLLAKAYGAARGRLRHDLTPLRLAAQMGKADMFEHILSRSKAVQWKWGPVTSYTIPLDEIDTMGQPGRQQVLDLIADADATEASKNMLSDEVLNGLLFTLIMDKWLRWGRTFFWGVYIWPKLVHVLLLTALAAPSVFESPALPGKAVFASNAAIAAEAWYEMLEVAVLVTSTYLLLLELFEALLTLCRGGHAAGGIVVRSRRYFRALCDRYGWITYLGASSAVAACSLLLTADDKASMREAEGVCVLLAIAVINAWLISAFELVGWNESIGIFNVLVGSMLASDIIRFMLLYLPMLFGFAAALTALFPSASAASTRSASFWSTLENLIVLSLVGEPAGMDLPDGSDTIYPTVLMAGLQAGLPLSQLTYYVLYCTFLVLVLVLLLNLLIAMMGQTYYKTMQTATMHWRIKFARLVLRLELLASHTPTALLCRQWPLAKALRDPQYWPWWMSFGAGARCAQSYIGGQGSFVFRTYDHVPHQSLIMLGQRTDPFRRHKGERTNEEAKLITPAVAGGAGARTSGDAPPTASEAALARQMQSVHDKLDKLLHKGGASAATEGSSPLPGPPTATPPMALGASSRKNSLEACAATGLAELRPKRDVANLLLTPIKAPSATASLPPIFVPPTKPGDQAARGAGRNGSYVMVSRLKKPE